MKILRNLLLAVLLCIASGCSQSAVEHVNVEAKGPYYENLSEVEKNSSIIIIAERLDQCESFVKKADRRVYSTYSLSSCKVLKVLKDDNAELKEGDVITVLEDDTLDHDTNIRYHVGGYDMMVSGKTYLLLGNMHDMEQLKVFLATGGKYGTVSLEQDGRKIWDPSTDVSHYEKIWKDAKEKYEE